MKRVSGKSLGTFFREEIAGPLDAEFWIGLPEELEPKVAPITMTGALANGAAPSPFQQAILADTKSVQALSLLNMGGINPNLPLCHAAEIGGAGGNANARGLARIYAPLACGGSLGSVKLVDADTLTRMGKVSAATHEDANLLIPTRFALGFMKSMDNRRQLPGHRDSVILGDAAFGHVGAGGSIGFADPECGLSLGYSMNRMGPGMLLNERGQSLVDAAYRALGYRTNAPGTWTR